MALASRLRVVTWVNFLHVSGAVDAIDDINDWGYEERLVCGDDASLLWAHHQSPNLTIYFSAGTDAVEGGGQGQHLLCRSSIGWSSYDRFRQQETDGGAEERVANIKVSMAGLTAGYELHCTLPQV